MHSAIDSLFSPLTDICQPQQILDLLEAMASKVKRLEHPKATLIYRVIVVYNGARAPDCSDPLQQVLDCYYYILVFL